MSRVNKVNPGQYTQAGRLTQDEAARELKKQRDAGSPKRKEAGHIGEDAESGVTPKDKSQDDEEP